MKKIYLFLCLFLFPIIVYATDYNTPVGNDIGYNGCLNFQDSKVISSKDGYFGHCKKATCYTGEWATEYYISSNMISCSNGNKNYYVQTINDGCAQYKGTCTPSTAVKYCSLVIYFDCTKTKNGEVYVAPTQPTTVTTTTKTTTRTTNTTKTTTRTTTKIITTIPTTTVSTTTIPLNTNNYLESLVLTGIDITFDKNTLIYNIEIDESIKNIEVKAKAESDKAIVTIENNNDIKENIPIKIIVTAENKSERIYTINVKYKVIEPEKIDNTLLDNIIIKDYDLKFNPNIKDYVLKIKDETNILEIEVVPKNENAIYVIDGNKDLSNKSKIKILVKYENEESLYTITIKKSTKIPINIIIYLLVIVVLIFVFNILRKVLPGKKDKNYDYE